MKKEKSFATISVQSLKNKTHENTIELIENIGIKPYKIAELTGLSIPGVYAKISGRLKFNMLEYKSILQHVKKIHDDYFLD